jgi:hypothetical protein
MTNFDLVIGVFGMVLILAAFIGDLFKKITEDFVIYNIMNIAGALALAYYAYALKSLPFLVLEFIWAIFAGYKLLLICKGKAVKK